MDQLNSTNVLAPVLALVIWTFVMWIWMYALRLPAIAKANIDAGAIKRKSDLDVLPLSVQQVADNYNHLHEQPILFYVLAFYTHLAGLVDPIYVALAWGYVGLRVVHSLIQSTFNFVPVRFAVFTLSSLVLAGWAVRCLLAL